MPLKFSAVCDLLQSLEKVEQQDPPLLKAAKNTTTRNAITAWFAQHRKHIDAPDANGVAILSTLFPERRTDRVYGIQPARLSSIAARCLRLNSDKTRQLMAARKELARGAGDLGTCLERLVRDTDGPSRPGCVTVDQLDGVLQRLAARSRFSGPEVRAAESSGNGPHELLGNIFLQLYSWEVKWLIRLILKDFGPVVLDAGVALRQYHFLLPDLLRVQNDFLAAVAMLQGPLRKYHSSPDLKSQTIFRKEAMPLLAPVVGVKTGRPEFVKARSLKNCLDLVGNSIWAVEQKYDGEYCEIHIDLSKEGCIKIFSKSGKDSTWDRIGLHSNIRDCLKIGMPDCPIKQKCILLGELVVYSDKEKEILEFHHIRKYVNRSGISLGTKQDSQPHEWEHLMIVFFDLLLLDDQNISSLPHESRREKLGKLIVKKRGRAITARRFYLDFSQSISQEYLLQQFAISLVDRHEGLILKPASAPYFSSQGPDVHREKSYFIKLKKDYMQDMGGSRDVCDFAVIGASYDRQQAAKCRQVRLLKWTDFFLGCLVNKEQVQKHQAKPSFKVMGCIKPDQCIPTPVLQSLNELGQFGAEPFQPDREPSSFLLADDQSELMSRPMEVTFVNPFVVEVLGSSYVKASNTRFYMLRHPRILKLHLDRTWRDAVCYEEVIELAMAQTSRGNLEQEEEQELVNANAGTAAVDKGQQRQCHNTETRVTELMALINASRKKSLGTSISATPAAQPIPGSSAGISTGKQTMDTIARSSSKSFPIISSEAVQTQSIVQTPLQAHVQTARGHATSVSAARLPLSSPPSFRRQQPRSRSKDSRTTLIESPKSSPPRSTPDFASFQVLKPRTARKSLSALAGARSGGPANMTFPRPSRTSLSIFVEHRESSPQHSTPDLSSLPRITSLESRASKSKPTPAPKYGPKTSENAAFPPDSTSVIVTSSRSTITSTSTPTPASRSRAEKRTIPGTSFVSFGDTPSTEETRSTKRARLN